MIHTKVCGLGTTEQVEWAIELGYDAIGVVVTPRSKRFCAPKAATQIARCAKGRIESFAVAFTLEEVGDLRAEFDTLQLYSAAPIPNLAYASHLPPDPSLACKYFFYDASVGSGVFADIPAWVKSAHPRTYIAGGLNADNVGAVIAGFQPFGVDVSSAVETAPLVKCRARMEGFMAAVRRAVA